MCVNRQKAALQEEPASLISFPCMELTDSMIPEQKIQLP